MRGSVDEADFPAFYLADGAVRSVSALNRPEDVIIGRRMVLGQLSPDPAALMDTDFHLDELVAPAGRNRKYALHSGPASADGSAPHEPVLAGVAGLVHIGSSLHEVGC